MSKSKRRLSLSARLAGMIGGLFLLFCVLLSIFFVSAFQSVAVRHLSILLRDMDNIPQTLADDCGDIQHNGQAIAAQMQTFAQLADLELLIFEEKGDVYLLQDGQLVRSTLTEQPPIFRQMADEALQGKTVCQAAEVSGVKRIVGAKLMRADTDGAAIGVIVTGAYAEFAQGLHEGSFLLLLIMAATFVCILFVAIFFSKRFVSSIKRIEQTALRLSEGDYAARTGISRTDEVGSLACAMVCGDYDRLRQLLIILIDNAVKYSSDGSQVTITLAPEDKCLLVQDEGCGIEPDLLSRIFDPYVRKSAQHKDGTGLGLAIAAEIAQKHGFRLTASSTVGEGSCFRLDMKKT